MSCHTGYSTQGRVIVIPVGTALGILLWGGEAPLLYKVLGV